MANSNKMRVWAVDVIDDDMSIGLVDCRIWKIARHAGAELPVGDNSSLFSPNAIPTVFRQKKDVDRALRRMNERLSKTGRGRKLQAIPRQMSFIE